jgi:plastocyanin
MATMKRQLFGAIAFATLAAGCSSSRSADVTVKTSEWIFEQSSTSVKAGDVKFRVDNVGGAEHELVVVRAAAPSALPTKTDGTVDEDQLTTDQKMGEVEKVAANTKKDGTLKLTAGTYVVFCNLVEKDGTSHFAKKMYGTLTVT